MTRVLTSSLFTILFLITSTSVAFACKGYEAPTYVGAMNRAQQAYYLEHNQYASSISQLGLGINEQNESRIYRTRKTANGVINYGISKSSKARECVKKCLG
jgi:Type IV pilin-like G and H, putative